MPAPKFFKNFSSKDSPKDSPDANPDTTHTKEIRTGTPTIVDPNIPQYSDSMKEAWSAANAELPRAHGAEKFLNNVGT